MQSHRDRKSSPGVIRTFLAKLGPGLITGASDDDPSGIGAYSIAGAKFGYSLLWTAWFLFPLMAAVQIMCARLGMVSGRGLAGLLRARYGGRIIWFACGLLAAANVVNIGADLGAMAAVTGRLCGLPPACLPPVYAVGIAALMAWCSYRRIAQVFQWMTLALFTYVAAAFLARPDWRAVLYSTFIPRFAGSSEWLTMFVALAGTTISPYLFFWQATQEVEEDREKGKATLAQRIGATDQETRDSTIDVVTGMGVSNLIMYAIILTTAATLHARGMTHIATTEQAADALRPAAGGATYLLFALGIIGTGMLSVPVLAGSTAFAIAEGGKWRNSLQYRPYQAPEFYGVLFAALLVGVALNYLGLPPVGMLFWSAVINGVLAPPLLALVILMSSDRRVLGDRTNGPLLRALGWMAFAVMTLAAAAMLIAV